MTELERARAHLRGCQIDLVWARGWHPNTIPKYETAVLAALSWVWEEQEAAEPVTKIVQTETGMAVGWEPRGRAA